MEAKIVCLDKCQSPDQVKYGLVAVIFAFVALMQSCALAPQQGEFSCPRQEGIPCLSISDADKSKAVKSIKADESRPSTVTTLLEQTEPSGYAYRTRETSKRIWFAPFEDADGNWHEGYYVYVVSGKPKWVAGK